MKVILKLAIIIASLLLVANVGFAQGLPCICYDVTITPEEGTPFNDFWEICISEDGSDGDLCSDGFAECYRLDVFGGGPNTPSFDMPPLWWQALVGGGIETATSGVIKADNGNCNHDLNGHIWTSGDTQYIYGVFQDERGRTIAKGQKVDCEINHVIN